MKIRHLLTISDVEAALLSLTGQLVGQTFATKCGMTWTIPDITKEDFSEWSLCKRCEAIAIENGEGYVPDRPASAQIPYGKDIRQELDSISNLLSQLALYAASNPDDGETLRDRLYTLHEAAHEFADGMCDLMTKDSLRMDRLN